MDEKVIRNVISILIVIIALPLSDLIGNRINPGNSGNWNLENGIDKDDVRYNEYLSSNLFNILIRLGVIVIAILIAIRVSKLSNVYFLTSLGILSLVIPIALQQPIQDFFAGVLLVLFDRIRNGDFIVTYSNNNNNRNHHVTGTITEIKTFTTQVKHPASEVISEIANSVLWVQSVEIKNRKDDVIELQLLLSHDNEITTVENLIKNILFNTVEVMNVKISHEHSNEGMRILILTDVEVKYKDFYKLKQELYRDLKIGLQAENVKFVN